MTHVQRTKLRIAAIAALGTSLLAAAAPAVISSPYLASWVWIR